MTTMKSLPALPVPELTWQRRDEIMDTAEPYLVSAYDAGWRDREAAGMPAEAHLGGSRAARLARALAAAHAADWRQVEANGGPPCFHLAGGRFCLRAQAWEGHGPMHRFVGLSDLLTEVQRQPEAQTPADSPPTDSDVYAAEVRPAQAEAPAAGPSADEIASLAREQGRFVDIDGGDAVEYRTSMAGLYALAKTLLARHGRPRYDGNPYWPPGDER